MDNNQDDEFHADLMAFLFGNEGDNQEVGVEEIPEAFEGVQENLEEGLGVGGNPQVVQVQENPAADAEQAQGAEILSDLDKAVVVYNARDSHDDHVGTSKKRGRPRKYATPEEARAAKTEKQRQRRRLRRITTVQGGEIPTDDTDQEFVALLKSVLEEDTESTAENKPSREIIDEELEEVTESTAENKPSREITEEFDWAVEHYKPEEFDDSHKVFEDWHDDSEFSCVPKKKLRDETTTEVECSGVPRKKRRVETTTEVEALERKHPEPSEPNPEGPKQSPTC